MTLIDTGPLVGLFDPRDPAHERCRRVLREVEGALRTTIPVLTEAFHLLTPHSRGADSLRQFVANQGLIPWFLDSEGLERAFELMELYADHPADLADASLVVAAERLGTRRIVTLDRPDFTAYRIRRGHRHISFQVVPC